MVPHQEYWPDNIRTTAMNAWREMVKKMLFSLEYYANYDERKLVTSDNELRRVEEGLSLFSKWYSHLWV